MQRLRERHTHLWLIAIVLAAFALRMIHLADVAPRWDEGWSVAHASLSLGEILRITAEDVHPPLYYLLLALWQRVVGVNLFSARYLSVLMSLPCVPLIYVVARAWLRRRNVATLSALLMAWLPLAVYYGAVVRMYALAPSFVLLAAYGALKPRRIWFVIGALGAMLTLYHSVWALAAIFVYAFVRASVFGRRSLVVSTLIAGVAYLPWAAYALPMFFARAAAQTNHNVLQDFGARYFVENGILSLTMSQQVGWLGVGVIAVILLLGTARFAKNNVLPMLAIALTLAGVSYAARQWAFNARMLITAAPFLALWLGGAIASLPRGVWQMALVALFGVYFNTSTQFVYAKSLEVFDPYDPHVYQVRLAQGRADDVAFFNVLSPAGFYALDRAPTNPQWSYALTWDPVIEDRARWETRITDAAQSHARLWVVLYRGLVDANGDLRGWLDTHFYPARGEWDKEDTFFGLYGVAREPLTQTAAHGEWGALELRSAFIGSRVRAGDVIPIELTWRTTAPLKDGYKVFVHALDASGNVVAQHDAQPLNDLRPFFTFKPNEDVVDRHGLALPLDWRGKLRVVVGVYEPASGKRVSADGQGDVIVLGDVNVK
jgi:hypothetical protein